MESDEDYREAQRQVARRSAESTVMLGIGETSQETRAYVLDKIRVTKMCLPFVDEEAQEILREEIRADMAYLVDLERWRRQKGLEKDEPYNGKGANG